MKIRAYSIVYDTDGAKIDLPKELMFEVPAGFNVIDDGAELISEQTGWAVHSFNYEEVYRAPSPADYIPTGLSGVSTYNEWYG